ncbi:MAG: hypothetical protein HRT44_14310, partial [Bdellovibrionales bacterium]|nr:hypothetical protein [Bdellovibrionales bacterium]NQZ20412.1 hypothetical protein [Bdellovibrionales bacterium]
DFVVKGDGSIEQTPSYGSLEGDVNATMNHMSLSEYTGNRLFFEILKSKFDQSIQYPQELVEHKIEGQTWIKVLVNHKGELIEVVDTAAKKPALKAFVIVGVHQALKKALHKKYWHKPQRNVTLVLHFNFKILTYGQFQSRATSRYHKNRYDFLRVQQGKHVIHEFMENNARYIPPIIPLPGGFFFSFTQAYNLVKAWSEMDPKIRKRQRHEMTKEKLDLMMKKAQKNHRRP